MRIGYKHQFRQNPFGYIDDLRCRSATAIVRLPWGGWCVSDANLAQELLRGPEFNGGMSAFFGDLLPTRTAQVAVGHAVRDTLRTHVPSYREALVTAVAELPAASQWPAAGTELVYRSLASVLLNPDTSLSARQLANQAVHGGIVFRAQHLLQRMRAEMLRGKLLAALSEEVRQRREQHADESRDVLDAVVGACPNEVTDRIVAQVFVVLFRSIVASVSSSLAWSVLLACLHHAEGSPWPWPADWIVREALRHRPMVWMVGRTVPRQTEFGGISFQPGDILSVSPYLLHHDEHRWTDADAFRPERWAESNERGPYIPFGAGPFTCAGASTAHMLMTEALAALTSNAHLSVTGGDERPVMIEGAVPRPFILHRTIKDETGTPEPEGGEQP